MQSHHPMLNVLLILVEHSSFFCPPHPANTCPEWPTGNGNYNGHYWHGARGKGFCGNFVWCWELFQKDIFFFWDKINKKLSKKKLLRNYVPFFSGNQMLLSSLLPEIPELSRFSNQWFKDHSFRSFSTPRRQKGNKTEKWGEEEKALLKTLLVYWKRQQNLCVTSLQTLSDQY